MGSEMCIRDSVKPRTDESTSQVSLLSRALSKAVAQLGEAREHHKQAAKLIRACSPNTRERLQQTLEDAAAFVEDLSDRVDFQIKSQIKERDANAKREQQLTSQKSAVLQAAGAGVPRPAHKPAQGVDIGNRNSLTLLSNASDRFVHSEFPQAEQVPPAASSRS